MVRKARQESLPNLYEVLDRLATRTSEARWLRVVSYVALVLKLQVIVWRNNAAPGSNTASAFARYWFWQIWRRFVRHPIKVHLPVGGVICIPTWSQIGGMLAATGFTEVRDQIFVQRLLRDGDLLVDVGANIGLYSVIAASAGARIEAFEPMPRAAEALRANLLLQPDIEFTVHELALSDRSGKAFLSEADVTSHLAAAGIPVTIARLDDVLTSAFGEMTLLKIDAEGHDADVLRGATEILSRKRIVIIVEMWSAQDEIMALLQGFGYEQFDFNWTEPDPFSRADTTSPNTIFVPDNLLPIVRERVTEPKALGIPQVQWRTN